jgi:hypothetical protein
MKFPFKGNKLSRKILLAGLLLAQSFADIVLLKLSLDPPAKYHVEASVNAAKEFKVVFDKR